MDLVGRDTFAKKIVAAALLRDEQQIGDRIGDDAVDLLWHRAIETSKTGLDVSHTDPELDRRECGRHGGVHVADHEDEVRARRDEDRLQPPHHLCRLHRVRGRADFEIEIGRRYLEVSKELPRQALVVMLPGMDQQWFEACHLPHLSDQRGDLHEVRAGAGHTDDTHAPTLSR